MRAEIDTNGVIRRIRDEDRRAEFAVARDGDVVVHAIFCGAGDRGGVDVPGTNVDTVSCQNGLLKQNKGFGHG